MVAALASETVIYPQFLAVTVMQADRQLSQQPQWCRKIDLTRGSREEKFGIGAYRVIL